ncbi:MAG: putative LPS assembly protein LptD [Cytophagales bacterium]|nr:putative LPS assembly protein LptD [Cytophagales bacterium]MDW8383171.1 putative LPS assembly protein LptD [Flammeovirgaceae bacterium]
MSALVFCRILYAQKPDTLKLPKPVKRDIETTIVYSAKDSMRFDMREKRMTMFGGSKVNYGEMSLEASQIIIYYAENTVQAKGVPDSTGKLKQVPVFKDKDQTFTSDSMIYNFKTRKGVIHHIITQQGEGYLIGERVKRSPTQELWLRNGKYTTCNLAEPHYAIVTKKMKTKPGKYVVSGPFNIELNRVPTPIGFPLGMFPIPKKRQGGLIFPTYGETTDRGFFLRDGGIFIPVNEYIGLKMLGQIYSRGGYGFSTDVEYRKKYAFDGRFNFSYNYNEREEPNLEKTIFKDYWIRWSHNPQSKGTGRFSASVNAGSSNFNRLNSFNINNVIAPAFSSSISYSKTFSGTPFSMSANLRQNQNIQTKFATLSPSIGVNMNRIFPFKKLSPRKNVLTQTNLAYSFNAQGEIRNTLSQPSAGNFLSNRELQTIQQLQQNFGNNLPLDTLNASINRARQPLRFDTLDLFTNLFTYAKAAQYSASHQVPISTNMTLAKYFTITPNFNFQQNFYQYQFRYTYLQTTIPTQKRLPNGNLQDTSVLFYGVRRDTIFSPYQTYSFNLGANATTRLYVFYYLKSQYISAIRHMITPTVGYSWRPDFSTDAYNFYQRTQIDPTGKTSPFPRFVGQGPGSGRSSAFNMNLSNQIEMKVRSKKDTAQEYVKAPILDNLSATASYNAIADSFRLSNISLNARTVILKKINIAFNGTLDPYLYSDEVKRPGYYRQIVPNNLGGFSEEYLIPGFKLPTQRRQDVYAWNHAQGLARLGKLMNANIAVGTSFASPQAKKDKKKALEKKYGRPLTPEEEQILQDIKYNPGAYVDFSVPWSLSLNYTWNFTQTLNPNTGEFVRNEFQTFQFSGDISLTEKWKITFSSTYDFRKKDFGLSNIGIFRDLHCWQLAATWVPFGPYQSYTLDINVKSSILQDLRITKRNTWYDRRPAF